MNCCASTASSKPASRNKSIQCGNKLSPMTNRGKICFSTTSSRKPCCCNNAAADEPAGPAPMINTSTSVCIGFSLRTQAMLLCVFRLQQGGHALDVLVERPVVFQFRGNTAHQFVKFAVIAAQGFPATARVRRLCQRDGFDGKNFPEQ